MKKTVVILIGLLVCFGVGPAIGQQTKPSSKKEKREAREKKQAEYGHFIDSLVQSQRFEFKPRSFERMPASRMRQLNNPEYRLGYWDGTIEVCLPYIKGYAPPYNVTVLNYSLPTVKDYVAQQTHQGWSVSFKTELFSADTYTFTLDIYSRTGSATLTIRSSSYSDVQYEGYIIERN